MAEQSDRDAVLREGRMCLSASPENRRILVISGARGIGKSTVANTIAEEAEALGFRVVDLPCLTVAPEGPPEWVATAADSTPTLLLIDDLHLLAPSVVGRVARAVKAAVRRPNVRCIATTVELVPPPLWREFAFHRLQPLPDSAVLALLRNTETTVLQRRAIIELSRGNPLAAIELARSWAGCGWGRVLGTEALERTHLTATLAEIGALDVAEVDETVRSEILRDEVRRTVSREYGTDHGFESAPRHSRVGTIARLWILASSTVEERVAAHRELAADTRLSDDERVVHRAQAARAPDVHLVDALQDRAEDMSSVHRYRQAVLLFCRAAVLASDDDRARALEVRAASTAAFAGHVDLAESIVDRLRLGRPDADASDTVPARAFAAVARGGDPRAAFGLVVHALDRLPESVDPDVVDQLIGSALAYSALSGDGELVTQAEQWAVKHEQHLDPVNVLIAESLGASGPRSHVRALDRPALRGAVRASLRAGEPWKPILLQLALPTLLWDPVDSRWFADLVHDVVGGSPAARALDRLRTLSTLAARGRFSAFGEAGAVETPDGLFAAQEHLLRTSTEALGVSGKNSGIGPEKYCTAMELVVTNRFDVAYERVRREDRSALRWSITPYGPLEMVDFVECCIRLRRPDDARSYLEQVHRTRPNYWGARHSALLTAAEAMLEDTGSEALFTTSLRELASAGWCFDAARVALVYGEWLRRHHRVVESRGQLTHAADLFGRLGAQMWLRRAEDELRAAGAGPRTHDCEVPVGLTGQEFRIASLAAAGLTNKEIGEQLYLSARTVGGHLYRVFPKLQITKRSALRDALLRYEALQPSAGR